MLTTHRRSASLIAFAVAVTAAVVTAPGAAADPAASCAALSTTMQQRVDDAGRAALITAGDATAEQAAAYPDEVGAVFNGSTTAAAGLTAVKLLTSTRNEDMFYLLDRPEVASAVARYHYVDQGVAFWASANIVVRPDTMRAMRRLSHQRLPTSISTMPRAA